MVTMMSSSTRISLSWKSRVDVIAGIGRFSGVLLMASFLSFVEIIEAMITVLLIGTRELKGLQ